MDEVNVALTAISTVGFPIVVACYMIYVNQQQAKAHKDEVGKMTEALTELKVTLAALLEQLRH